MTVKHPHDAVIRAWLDGKSIQLKASFGWEDVVNVTSGAALPRFTRQIEYRIKPEDPEIWVDMCPTAAAFVRTVKMKQSEFNRLAGIKD